MQPARQLRKIDILKIDLYLNFIPLPVAFVDVVFGMPSKQCRGFGVCRVETMQGSQFEERLEACRPIFNKGLATLHHITPNSIQLRVRKSSLDKFTFGKYFSKGKFLIEEKVEIELFEVCYVEKEMRTITFLPGNYRIGNFDDLLLITLNIT